MKLRTELTLELDAMALCLGTSVWVTDAGGLVLESRRTKVLSLNKGSAGCLNRVLDGKYAESLTGARKITLRLIDS